MRRNLLLLGILWQAGTLALPTVAGLFASPYTPPALSGEDATRLAAVVAWVPWQTPDRPEIRANHIATFADDEVKNQNNVLAAELYGYVSDHFPNTPVWGRSTFSRAHLLRELGSPEAAEMALERLLPSAVNGPDRAPKAMTDGSYGNDAAWEVAACRADRLDYPGAYIWGTKAFNTFGFHSWCGTCLQQHVARERRQLAWAALKAGPLFVVAHLLSPSQSWMTWLKLAPVALVLIGLHKSVQLIRVLRSLEDESGLQGLV